MKKKDTDPISSFAGITKKDIQEIRNALGRPAEGPVRGWTWSEVSDKWNQSDPAVPTHEEIKEMGDLQQRIDAGEDVVIPEKKEEKLKLKWSISSGLVNTTRANFTPGIVDTVLKSNILYTTYGGNLVRTTYPALSPDSVTTNPADKNSINKYTGKKMKYNKKRK